MNLLVEIASLDEVPLREVWPDEARDFTPWLAANPDQLGKALQMDLELEGSEFAVGPFSADVVLQDANSGQRVVVENLLVTTDHDHLGKLITYAAGLEARWAVLVARSFRPEHRSALTLAQFDLGRGERLFWNRGARSPHRQLTRRGPTGRSCRARRFFTASTR